MDQPLCRLLDAVWEHDLPLGPLGELEERQRAEREWEDSLSADDCLTLLNWIERPTRPPGWEPSRERWIAGLVDRAAYHVGRAGRRLHDPRITGRLLELLTRPDRREVAIEGLTELADPSAFDAMLGYLGDRDVRDSVGFALAHSASPDQADRLRSLAATASTPELREAAAEVVAEWEVLRRESSDT